jgi:hypothetical protein
MSIIFDAFLYFGSFSGIIVLFGSVIAILLWILKMALKALGRFVRAITDQ